MKFRNFGQKSLSEIEQVLIERGLSFGMDLGKLGLDKLDLQYQWLQNNLILQYRKRERNIWHGQLEWYHRTSHLDI